jgi:transcriptional regulator with XRE-family HTH domain
MSVGERIKKFRLGKGLTLRDLSKQVDISISFLSDIENGRSNPSLERLKDIAAALNTPISVLLGEENINRCKKGYNSTLDEEITQIIKELGPEITLQLYNLKEMTEEEKENLKIFLQGLKARRNQMEKGNAES